jgi:hypothetical protein
MSRNITLVAPTQVVAVLPGDLAALTELIKVECAAMVAAFASGVEHAIVVGRALARIDGPNQTRRMAQLL